MQFYTDPSRESDAHALPDAEVFQASENPSDPELGHLEHGQWYWWPCSPGCPPDGDPIGPFDSEALAIANARSDREPEPTPNGPCPDESCPGSIVDGDCSHCGSDFAHPCEMETLDRHTPGPWERARNEYSGGQYDILADDGRKTVAETIGAPHEANARLIAAAPSLLAFAVTTLDALDKEWNVQGELDRASLSETTLEIAIHARQAIADAQGGGPWSTSSGALTRQLRKDLDHARKQGGAA